MDIRFLGHAAFALEHGGTTVLIDPFLTGNPAGAASADEVAADTILLSHGHGDHYGDTVAIAKRTGATVVAITEIAGEIGEEGVEVLDTNLGGTLVYHLGDTCLFSDLQLIARRGDKVDVALVPIGGHYTMDRHDAVTAVEFIDPSVVIPVHYDTFPPIETDAEAFKADVESRTSAKVVILAPGETHSA